LAWGYEDRNYFQIEVYFAILVWRVAANFGELQGWRTQALQALGLVIGIYIIQAEVIHPSN
jgi:hypothetical protein